MTALPFEMLIDGASKRASKGGCSVSSAAVYSWMELQVKVRQEEMQGMYP